MHAAARIVVDLVSLQQSIRTVMEINTIPPLTGPCRRRYLIVDLTVNHLDVIPRDVDAIKTEVLDFKISKYEMMVATINLPACLIRHVDAVQHEILKNEVSSCSPRLDRTIAPLRGVPRIVW